MKITIQENNWLSDIINHGWGNGYVLIPTGHEFYGKDYNEINKYVDVHGGLTFSEKVDKELAEKWGLSKSSIGEWCVGFDTCHLHDTKKKWTMDAVVNETIRLRDQIMNYEK